MKRSVADCSKLKSHLLQICCLNPLSLLVLIFPTPPAFLAALPLLSDQALAAWPESICRAGLLPFPFAAASPGS
jgi:hypothetical protein